ncbi:putative E3 ubiquitin-protein ligase [Coemansia sp. RSA 485]|nr:putative E3 ubiquitin-protein ligase [Coemansia sp. RSA 485]
MVVSQFFSPLRTLKNKARGSRHPLNHSDDDDDEDEITPAKDPMAHKPAKPMTTGTCLCCGSKVSFPPSVSCFKCTVCDTINDLRPLVRTEKVSAENNQMVTRTRVPPPPLTLDRLKAGVVAYRKHPEKQSLLEAMIRESFANWDVLNFSFVVDDEIDIDEVHAAYKIVLALPPPFIRAMMSGIESILRRPGRPLLVPSDIRYLLVILENPLLLQQTFPQESSYHHHIVKSIVGTLANLPNKTHYDLVLWLSHHSRSSIKRKVLLINQFITYRVQKYDRARRRNKETKAAAAPLTSYSEQSAQTELPAFQRTRSATNAPLPHPMQRNHDAATGMRGRPGRHNRMRSNTDSRISLSSHEKASVIQELEEQRAMLDAASKASNNREPVPSNPHFRSDGVQERQNSNGPIRNGAVSATESDSRLGLGFAGMRVSERHHQQQRREKKPTRFASMGAAMHSTAGRPPIPPPPPLHAGSELVGDNIGMTQYRNHRSCTTGAWAAPMNDPTPPPAAHARNSPRTAAGIVTDASDALMRQSYYIPLRSNRDFARHHTTLETQANTGMTNFIPLSSPPADDNLVFDPLGSAGTVTSENSTGGSRLRAASMSAGDLPALSNVEVSNNSSSSARVLPIDVRVPDEPTRPVRDSVMGVLSGTAEPSSPVSSVAGRTSLTRTRSSSEAPIRRTRADHELLAAMERPLAQATMGDRNGGVDLDDYYVGADGVFYPKTSSLVMHQHDWRLVTAAKVMALLHAANLLLPSRSRLSVDAFYNDGVDNMDLISDYDAWQARVSNAFSFCQYPFLLSLRAKVQIMQVDAARQMDSKLKEAVISALFQNYHSRISGTGANQPHLKLFIRRNCLVEDSLHQLATHEQDLKKRLKIEFVGEEGIDAGGLTKEWFMLLIRELMNPLYGMFVSESDDGDVGGLSFWFNPASLETGNQYFLVGVVVGLALYNSTILDLHLPLAVFKKLLRTSFYQYPVNAASAAASVSAYGIGNAMNSVSLVAGTQTRYPLGGSAVNGSINTVGSTSGGSNDAASASVGSYTTTRLGMTGVAAAAAAAEGRSPIYGLLSASAQLRYQINEMLSDVSQFRPHLARGLRQLLQYRENDVEDIFCLSFEANYNAYGEIVTVPLIPNGSQIPVTSQNRVEYVMRYLQWILNDSVARQFEPFRRGFYYVCGGNALSLFKPEEIELMVHGSGEDWKPEDLRAITEYVGFGRHEREEKQLVDWFWEILQEISEVDRKLFLAFVTGADRMPLALGCRLKMKLALLGDDCGRLPVAHTCFNQLGIWMYKSKEELKEKLVLAIRESEGFGLK